MREAVTTDTMTNNCNRFPLVADWGHDGYDRITVKAVARRPMCVGLFHKPRYMIFFLSCCSFIQGFTINGLNSVNATSLERRFGLSSSNIGIISSIYDISAALLGLLVSHIASRVHKPKLLGMSVTVMGIGSLVMVLPHFTTEDYKMGQNITNLCHPEKNMTDCTSRTDFGLSWYMYIFLLGQILHGMGGAALYTIGFSYIDDNVSRHQSPLHVSIFMCTSILGVASGYIIGGQLLEKYVDFTHVSSDRIDVGAKDPRWVGAWWIGYLVGGLASLTAGPLLLLLPKLLPGEKNKRKQLYIDRNLNIPALTNSENCCQESKQNHLVSNIRSLAKNLPFVLVTISTTAESIIIGGFATFLPKFIQNQFYQSSSWAALLSGVIVVPGGAGGQLIGGICCRRWKLDVRGMSRMCILALAASSLGIASFWLRCEDAQMAGITVSYNNRSSRVTNIRDTCNADCACTTEVYDPVCSFHGVQYFSPCHAGCRAMSQDGKIFENCSCVEASRSGISLYSPSAVSRKMCSRNCTQMYIFLPVFFVVILCTFMAQTPFVSIILRCTTDEERTLALGLNTLVSRLLGSLPGPLVFGIIIDQTCKVWQKGCDEDNSCWIYNNTEMSLSFLLLFIAIRTVSILCFTLVYCRHRTEFPLRDPSRGGERGWRSG